MAGKTEKKRRAIRERWTYTEKKRRARAGLVRRSSGDASIDLRMGNTSDFTISYCPTNI